MAKSSRKKPPRIAIVGAGPAGLATAWYLKKAGFRDVTVLERLERVGGLCQTITVNGVAFDLGANYLTPAYARTLEIAREVGAETYVAKGIQAAWVGPDGEIDWSPPPPPDPPALLEAMGRYLEIREKLPALDHMPMGELPDELLVSFRDWLDANGLSILEPLFWIPITTMGYGFLDEIPAPYALHFMSPATFLPIFLRALPQMRSDDHAEQYVVPWPKKLTEGFQRLWERVAWQLDVRLGVEIEAVKREKDGKVEICFTQPGRGHHRQDRLFDERCFEAVILACPLDVVGEFMKLSKRERKIFERIRFNSYVVSSYTLKAPIEQIHDQAAAFFPADALYEPWAIGQIAKGRSNFIQFFSRVPPEASDEEVRREVDARNRKLLSRISAEVDDDETWTFDRWPYFQHFAVEDLRKGVLERLEAMQGERSTWYVGGGSHFELVESAVDHAYHVVRRFQERFAPG